jgi:hypothetical protein
MVTARMAGLSPGTSPPPVRIPMIPFFVLILAIAILLLDCLRMGPLRGKHPFRRGALIAAGVGRRVETLRPVSRIYAARPFLSRIPGSTESLLLAMRLAF